MPARVSDGELIDIGEAECWRLLGTQQIGRIGLFVGSYPVILPVNYSVAAHGIVFQTGTGQKLWASHRSNVCLEVDEIDPDSKTGWSVLVKGSVREITPGTATPELIEVVRAAAPVPWAPGPREHVMRIVTDSISGRRIPRQGELGSGVTVVGIGDPESSSAPSVRPGWAGPRRS